MGKKQILSLNDFSGGMNVRDGARGLRNNELQLVQDLYCENGQLVQVEGASGWEFDAFEFWSGPEDPAIYSAFSDVVGLDKEHAYVAARGTKELPTNSDRGLYKIHLTTKVMTSVGNGPPYNGNFYGVDSSETLPIIWPGIKFGEDIVFFPNLNKGPGGPKVTNKAGEEVGDFSSRYFFAPALFNQRIFVREGEDFEYRFCGINNYSVWDDHLVLEGREKPVCSVAFSGNLFVFGEENTHVIFGRSALSFGTRRLLEGITTYHANSIQIVRNRIVFLGRDNKLYAWDGTINNPVCVSEKVNRLFESVPGLMRSSVLGNRYYLSISRLNGNWLEDYWLNLVFDFGVLDSGGQPFVSLLSYSPKFLLKPGFIPGSNWTPGTLSSDHLQVFKLNHTISVGGFEDIDSFFGSNLSPEIKTGELDFGTEVSHKRLLKSTFGVNRFSKFNASFYSRALLNYEVDCDSGDSYSFEGQVPVRAGINGSSLSVSIRKSLAEEALSEDYGIRRYFNHDFSGEPVVLSHTTEENGYRGPVPSLDTLTFGLGGSETRLAPSFYYKLKCGGVPYVVYSRSWTGAQSLFIYTKNYLPNSGGTHLFAYVLDSEQKIKDWPSNPNALFGLPNEAWSINNEFFPGLWKRPVVFRKVPDDESSEHFMDYFVRDGSGGIDIIARVFDGPRHEMAAGDEIYEFLGISDTEFMRSNLFVPFKDKVFCFYASEQYGAIAYRELTNNVSASASVQNVFKEAYTDAGVTDSLVFVDGGHKARDRESDPTRVPVPNNFFEIDEYMFVVGHNGYFVVMDENFRAVSPTLPYEERWVRMFKHNSNYFFVGERDVWFSQDPMNIFSWRSLRLPPLYDACMAGNILVAFCQNGSIAMMTDVHDLKTLKFVWPKSAPDSGPQTFDGERLSYKDGVIYISYRSNATLFGDVVEMYNGFDGLRSINLEFEMEAS